MIYHGHCLDVLRTLPEASVHCVVTSPPYWSLRDYGVPPSIWGGDEACEHGWGEEGTLHKGGPHGNGVLLDGGRGVIAAQAATKNIATGRFCARCDAWLGCLGLEPTPDLFVEHLVFVFREVRRVLRDDGTLWLNMGDCYASGPRRDEGFNERWHGKHYNGQKQAETSRTRPNRPASGLKPKDLVGVPWMLAFALRADGWYLRAENIWAKGVSFCESWAGSVMPESVTDRTTKSHEQVFLLAKSPRYFFDMEAVRENGSVPAGTRAAKGSNVRSALKDVNGRRPPEYWEYNGKRNLRSVWAISPKPFPEAHFATFPEDLVIPCIAAGTSAHGVCPDCGAPYRRIVEMEAVPEHIKEQFEAARAATASDHGRGDGFTTRRPNYQRERTGERWESTCECNTTQLVPATVLDPFAGSGTVGVVCAKMLRRFVGIELNQTYIETIAEPRIRAVAPLFAGD